MAALRISTFAPTSPKAQAQSSALRPISIASNDSMRSLHLGVARCDGWGSFLLPYASGDLIGRATVLPYAKPYNYEPSANAVFRGQIVVGDESIRNAFVKDLSTKQLANELLTAALARWVGLPIPDPFLAFVPSDVLPFNKAPRLADGSGFLAFASADADTPSVARFYNASDPAAADEICQRLSGWSGIGRLYGFDSWIANTDRNQGNILLLFEDVFLIDHDQSFTGDTWTSEGLDPTKPYKNKIKDWLTPYVNESDRPIRAKEAETLLNGYMEGFEHVMAASFAGQLLSTNDIQALLTFITDRVKYIGALASDALCIEA